MKVTALYVYPIKALRGIRLDSAELTPQGIRHDRRFMLCKVDDAGGLQKVQLDKHARCARFSQEFVDDAIHVRYLPSKDEPEPEDPRARTVLEVPLEPDVSALERAHINLHQSLVSAYRMGAHYDEWFSACFGFDTVLVFIGDQRRPVLGTLAPSAAQPQKGWLSSISGYVTGGAAQDPEWLAFSDCAPYLIATEASLANVRARLEEYGSSLEIIKFRPNIVVDGDEQWEEDFWAELAVDGEAAFTLSKMCNRCASVNVDYETGKPGVGEQGSVLKKLMSDRRVDPGSKYSPVFGRYAFLTPGTDGLDLAVGADVSVTKHAEERPTWDWPIRDPKMARFYSGP